MSDETNIIDNRPWYHQSTRIKRNPFDPVYPIEDLEWCRFCKMDVDVQVEAANADGIDVYRKRCKRCGNVMQHGMARRNIVDTKPLPKKARDFIKQKGIDRR